MLRVCSRLQHTFSAVLLLLVTAASGLGLLLHNILLNSVLLSLIVSGSVWPTPPRTNTPRS